jgi:hypothetical protein
MTVQDLIHVEAMKVLWPILALIAGEVFWRSAVYSEMRRSRKDRANIYAQQQKMWLALINHEHNAEGRMILTARDLREQFTPPAGDDSGVRDLRPVGPDAVIL